MGRTYTAVLADGQAVQIDDVPDNVHPNEVIPYTEKKFGQSVRELVPQDRALLDEIAQGGKDLLRGFGKAYGTGIETMTNLLSPGNWEGDENSPTKLVEKAIPTPKNDPMGRQRVRGVLEATGGAFAGPGGLSAPIRTAAVGAMGGAGAELAGALTNDAPGARLAGGLAGGLGGSMLLRPKLTRQDLRREVMDEVSDPDLARAEALMREARANGVSLNLSQALPKATNIDQMVETLANSKHGKQTVDLLRRQPAEIPMVAEGGLSGLPGKIRSTQEIGNAVQEASDDVIRMGMQDAQKAWQAKAPKDVVLPPQAVAALDAKLKTLAARYPNTSGADLIEDARSALMLDKGSPGALVPVGSGKVSSGLKVRQGATPSKYLTDPLQLKAALDDNLNTFGSRKLNTMGSSATNLRRAQEVREAYREVLEQYAPKLREADAAYSSVMDSVVNPTKKSVIGRMAGRAGVDDAVEAVQGKVFKVLDSGTLPGSHSSEILTLETQLRKAGKQEVFQDTVKTWLSDRVAEAVKTEGGRASPSTASNLEKALVGNPKKAQGFDDAMVALARSKNLPDDALLPGMKNMMKYISATANRPKRIQGVSQQDLAQAGQSSAVSAARGLNFIQPLRTAGDKLNDMLNADAYKFMDNLLNTPEGVATLRKLGKTSVMSRGMEDTLTTFLATQASQPAAE